MSVKIIATSPRDQWVNSFALSLEVSQVSDQGPVSLMFFACNSNSMETSSCCDSVAGHQIATIFCTCHDSTAVVPCTKFCSVHSIRLEIRVKRNFHRIWNAMEKTLVCRGPVLLQVISGLAPIQCHGPIALSDPMVAKQQDILSF